jgi:rhodanese-related sulfurtransferase
VDGPANLKLPPGTSTVARTLAAIAEQTPLASGRGEDGHGVWLFLEGQKQGAPVSSAVPWDRAFIQAYPVRDLLRTLEPDAIVRALQTHVDPGQWEDGLPAASVFLPTQRLIVVHDEHGHRRVRAALGDLAAGRIKGVEMPSESKEQNEPDKR